MQNIPSAEEDQGPNLKSLDFWTKLNTLCAFIVDEDKSSYAKAMNVFPECDIFEISAVELWKLYTGDLAHAMEEHAKHKLCTTTDYMNLQVYRFFAFKS